MGQQEELKELYDEYRNDARFEKLRGVYGINFVPGDGPINHPSIMLVGEAPGKYENMKARPFVGPSSKILEKILRKVSINTEDVFFTNVVKYWPKNSNERSGSVVKRDITKEEFEVSKSYLVKEINIIDPLFVGLCGIRAIHTFFPSINDIYTHNGKLLEDRFVALYHPGLVHHDKEKYETVEKGFKELKYLIDVSELKVN